MMKSICLSKVQKLLFDLTKRGGGHLVTFILFLIPFFSFSQPQAPPTFSATLVSLTNSEKTALNQALNTDPSMYEVFSIDLNAMDGYVQSQTGTVDFILNIRSGWSWVLSLEKDIAWASTLFEDYVFEGVADNIDTNRVSLHIAETQLFGYITNGTDKFRISSVSDILGSSHSQHFVIYPEQLCDFNPADISDISINLELGLEADYDLYYKFQQAGFTDPALEISSRIVSKMMVVEEFYQQFFPNLNFIYRGPYVRTASFGGDYPNYLDSYTRTNQIRAAWKSRYSCIPVDAVMLFSGSNLENDGEASHSDAGGDHYSTAFRPVSYVDVSSSGLSSFTGHNDRKAMTAAHELGHIMAFMGHVDDNQSCQADGVPCLTNTNPTPGNRVSILCRDGGYADSMCEWKLGTCPGNMMLSKFIQFKDEYLTEIRPVPSLPCEASISCLELQIETDNAYPFPPSSNCGNRDEMNYVITVCNPCAQSQEKIQVAFRQVTDREEIVNMDEGLDNPVSIGQPVETIFHKSDFFNLAIDECKQFYVTTSLKNGVDASTQNKANVQIFTEESPTVFVKEAITFFTTSANTSVDLSGGTDNDPKEFSTNPRVQDQINDPYALPNACNTTGSVKNYSFTGVVVIDLENSVFTYTVGAYDLQNEYCFNNATIQINENAKILVRNGTLHISDSRILGCASLWNSIIVEPGATLIMENTFIEDGEYAIQAKPGAHVEIKNCTFRDNYVAFYVADGGSALPQSINLVQFYGNVIETQDALKAPRAGQKAYAGVLVNNATNILVGNEGEGIERNRFRNLYSGIVSFNSNVTVKNTAFNNIHPEEGILNPYHGYAIYAEAVATKLWPWLMAKGFGKDSDPAFDDCTVGIGLHSMRATVEQCRMSNVILGIYSQQSRFRALTFKDNNIEALYYGIGLFQNTPASIKVENNTIDIDDASGVGAGILLAENPNGLANHAANRIANNTINLKHGRAGILSYSGRYFEFYKNTINLELDDKQSAIHIEGMADGLVRCNIVNSLASTTLNARGIAAKGAFSSIFSCNYLNDTKIGMSFDGMGDQSVVRGNEFTGQAVGLQMEMNGYIGPQSHKGNRWFGSFGEFGAKHLGTTEASVLLSQFIVDPTASSGQAFTYSPTWDAVGQWFVPEDIEDDDIFKCATSNACATTSPPVNIKDGLGEMEAKLARGSFSSPQFTTELTWTGRRHLYSRIAENSIPLQNNTYVNSFYTNAANSVIEQLHEAGQSIKEALTLSAGDLAALEGYSDDIEDYLADLRQNSEALSTDTSTSGITALHADRAAILADLAATIGAADTLSADLYDELLDNIASAGTVNNSVASTAVYEVNEKDYNSLFITSIEADTFTTSQKSTLWNIANQCPLEGGDGVYHARSLYALIDPLAGYNDMTLCSGQQSFSVPAIPVFVSAAFELYPNPASDFIVLRPLGLDEEAQVIATIYDPLGREIQRAVSSGNEEFILNTIDIPSGIIWVTLSVNGVSMGTRAVVVKK